MKWLASYLGFGCLLLGVALGEKSEMCGVYQRADPMDAISIIVVWPAYVVEVAFYEADVPEGRPCDGAASSPSHDGEDK